MHRRATKAYLRGWTDPVKQRSFLCWAMLPALLSCGRISFELVGTSTNTSAGDAGVPQTPISVSAPTPTTAPDGTAKEPSSVSAPTPTTTPDGTAKDPINDGGATDSGVPNPSSNGANDAGDCGNCACASFEGSAYAFCTEPEFGKAAQQVCTSIGMNLAKVESAEENAFLAGTAAGLALTQLSLGGRDVMVEGEWRWRDSSVLWRGGPGGMAPGGRFTQWGANQPDNLGDQDCLILEATPQAIWRDDICSTPQAFVCEK